MKNHFIAFLLALLIVLSSVSLRRSVAGIGGSPIPLPPPEAQASNALGIGGSPIPLPPPEARTSKGLGIGGSPIPLPPPEAVSR